MSIEAKLIALLVLILAFAGENWYVYNAGNRNGTNAVLAKTQAAEIGRKDLTINTLTDADKANKALAAKQAADAKQEVQNHEKELNAVRARAAADAARRVPIDPAKFCAGGKAGGTQAGPAGSDGQSDTAAAFLPEQFTSDLRQAAAYADEVAADLRTLKARTESASCFAGAPLDGDTVTSSSLMK